MGVFSILDTVFSLFNISGNNVDAFAKSRLFAYHFHHRGSFLLTIVFQIKAVVGAGTQEAFLVLK